MDLDKELPFKVCLNPPRMEERRQWISEMFRMHRLKVLRWPSSEKSANRHHRGFAKAGLRENYLTFMLAARKARALKSKALLFLEDDVTFDGNFRDRTAELHLPEDWGLLYFGCLHIERPQMVTPGLVRVSRALDTHAVAVHERYYTAILHSLHPRRFRHLEGGPPPLDVALSHLHQSIPTYAAWPNLAWQRVGFSHHNGCVYSNYTEEGRQKFMPDIVAGM